MSLKGDLPNIDLLIHFAGLSHSIDPKRYDRVNYNGTLDLAKRLRGQGCRKMVYVSSLRAARGAGEYGESKLKAEAALRSLDWDILTILRPSEVYGGEGKEGVDRLLKLAARFHVVPMLLGDSRISFRPLAIDDFVEAAIQLICEMTPGTRIVNLYGPEQLSGRELALRIGKKFRAVPLPVFWPLLIAFARVSRLLRQSWMTPDQLQRVTCKAASDGENMDQLSMVLTRFLEN